MAKAPVKGEEPINAWLGEEIRLDGGTLRFEGCLRVDGSVVDGTLAGKALIVGEAARISGRVDVERLSVYGTFDGRATVKESAWVGPGATFAGEMQLGDPELIVEEGADFECRVTMVDGEG